MQRVADWGVWLYLRVLDPQFVKGHWFDLDEVENPVRLANLLQTRNKA